MNAAPAVPTLEPPPKTSLIANTTLVKIPAATALVIAHAADELINRSISNKSWRRIATSPRQGQERPSRG